MNKFTWKYEKDSHEEIDFSMDQNLIVSKLESGDIAPFLANLESESTKLLYSDRTIIRQITKFINREDTITNITANILKNNNMLRSAIEDISVLDAVNHPIFQVINSEMELELLKGRFNKDLEGMRKKTDSFDFEKLKYEIINKNTILGDTNLLFSYGNEFMPYYDKNKIITSVILPISPNQILVGGDEINLNNLSEEIAKSSLDYFLSDSESVKNKRLSELIGTNCSVVSEDVIAEFVRSNIIQE